VENKSGVSLRHKPGILIIHLELTFQQSVAMCDAGC
jgi:hypothetical protein